MHPAWAARSDLPRPLGPQAAPPPQSGLGPQVGARLSSPRLRLLLHTSSPPPSPLLPVPAAASRRPRGLGSYTPPPASGPSPRFCPRPPPASPAASAAPGLAPRASCGGGGTERRQAQPGRWGQRHTEARRLGERRRGGRDGAWTAVDRERAHQAKRSAQQAQGTERGGTGDLWPSMHRVSSPTAEQPPGKGDNTRRTPQPRLKLVGKRRCREWRWVELDSGMGSGGWRSKRGHGEAARGWEVETDGKGGECSNCGILGANKDPTNLDTIEYCLLFHSRLAQWA